MQTLHNFVELFGSVGMPESINEDALQVQDHQFSNSFDDCGTDSTGGQ
jgi:hypothetical protein